MVDRELMRRRLALLNDALADLRRYRSRYDAATLANELPDLEQFAAIAATWP